MKKRRMRRNWSKNDQLSQKRTQAQIKKLHNDPFWLLSNESISIDRLVSFENSLDFSWE